MSLFLVLLHLLQPTYNQSQLNIPSNDSSVDQRHIIRTTSDKRLEVTPVKGTKGTISLAQAKYMVPGPNCMLKSL